MKFLSISSITLVSVIVVQALPYSIPVEVLNKAFLKNTILKTNSKFASSSSKGIVEEAHIDNYLKKFESKPPLAQARDASGNVIQRLKPNEANAIWKGQMDDIREVV